MAGDLSIMDGKDSSQRGGHFGFMRCDFQAAIVPAHDEKRIAVLNGYNALGILATEAAG